MAVTRYRDVSEMPEPPRPSGAELVRRIRAVMGRAARLAGLGYPAGVHRFRTLEQAQAARDAVTRDRARLRIAR